MSATKRLLVFFLAFVVFISSGGVVLAVHYCSMKASKEISLFQHNSCCSDTPKTCEKNNAEKVQAKKCCDLKVTYHKVDMSTIISAIDHLDILVPALDDLSFNFCANKTAFVQSILSNKAPPFFSGGKTFLILSQLFLI